MYYIFMFRGSFSSFSLYLLNRTRCSCWCSKRWSDAASFGKPHDHQNMGVLTDDFMPKAPTITAWTLTVSASLECPAAGLIYVTFKGSRLFYTVSFRRGFCSILPRC